MRKIKRTFSIILIVVVVGLLALLLGYSWYLNEVNTPASSKQDTVTISVADGETLTQIAAKLKELGAIRNLEVFKIYIRLNPQTFNLQVGTYTIPQDLTIPELLGIISKGPESNSAKVLIPEGLRADEVAQILFVAFADQKTKFNTDEFMDIVRNPSNYQFASDITEFLAITNPEKKSLEGFLFPDTYNVGLDAGPKEVIELLVRNFMVRIGQNDIAPTEHGRLNGFYDVLKLATIVQREANSQEDMKLVADIFLRRYEQGWVLGSDVAVLYAYKRWYPEPSVTELAASDPYNLRLLPGLTPTPICNPGIGAIKAVLSPTPNQYYYFIADSAGKIHFATTAAEHQANINKYL